MQIKLRTLFKRYTPLLATVVLCMQAGIGSKALAKEPGYECSNPPLEVTFSVAGGHYNGKVNCGNLFLAPDIPNAPVVRWKDANPAKLYTLMMLDYDGNAFGSYPDAVAEGKNSTVRHWIVGNIPGELLRGAGYVESHEDPLTKKVQVVQPFRSPRIPMVSDRYALYVFEQPNKSDFETMSATDVINFKPSAFFDKYKLGAPKASNYFVALYTSESPFSGKPFHGNDVSAVWHKDLGKGKLGPSHF